MWDGVVTEKLIFHLQCLKGYLKSVKFTEEWLMLLFYVNESPDTARPTSKIAFSVGRCCHQLMRMSTIKFSSLF